MSQNNFSVFGSDSNGQPGTATIISASTNRIDGVTEANNGLNDEYVTITFSAKTSVSNFTYTKGQLAGMNGILVETQSIPPVE